MDKDITPCQKSKRGAHDRNRTDDLFLTKEVLYQLSYVGDILRPICRCSPVIACSIIHRSCVTYDHTEQQWSGERVSNPQPSAWKADALPIELPPQNFRTFHTTKLVEREGFEPSKAYAGRFTVCSLRPLGHLSNLNILAKQVTSPNFTDASQRLAPTKKWSWRWDLNPQPADYKSAALPIELHQRSSTHLS
jgi:hypothetical protein